MSATKKTNKSKKNKAKASAPKPEAPEVEVEVIEPTEVDVEPAAEEAASEEPGADAKAADANEDVTALTDRLTRLQADFENYRRRVLREKDATYRRANEDIMEEMLPVLDHLDMAFSSASAPDLENPVVVGVKLVADQLRGALSKFGLEAIDAEGQSFDPNWHEAISHLPSPDVEENGVMAQVRCGYKLGSYLLRPAQVVVSSGVPAAADSSEEAPEVSEENA
jgi:molecular chaperone GrpE